MLEICPRGLEGYSCDRRLNQNIVRDSGNINGIRVSLPPGSGIRQNLGTDSVLGKKTIFGIVMTEV